MAGLSKLVSVAGGSLLKAALVGANTVNGPASLARSAKPAATSALSSVEWLDDKPALAAKSLPVEVPIDDDDGDMPLVPVWEVDIVDPGLDIVDPDACERGIVVLPVPLWVGIVLVVVWAITVQVMPTAKARPKIVCLIIM